MNCHLLIIASDFPPLAGTNTQRVQSFVRHLPTFGWVPIVISRAVEDLAMIDSSQSLRLAKNLTVHRVPDPDIFARLNRRNGRRAVDLLDGKSSSRPLSNAPSSEVKNLAVRSRSIVRLVLGVASEAVMAFRRYFSYLPDALAPWAHASATIGVKVCREQSVQVVLASAPSYSCLVAGLALANKCGLPFVADFRDLWVGRPYRRVLSRWHDWYDHHLERRVVLGAQRIILASPAWMEHFQKTYGKSVAEKCVVITNGYDESLIPKGDGHLSFSDSVTTFLNTGAMYGSESPLPFLEALGNVLLRQPDLRNHVRVRLIGYAGDDENELIQAVDQLNLNSQVKLIGPQPHDTCLQEQKNADILLLFSGVEHRDTLSGKSFEYMSTGKPILAMIHDQGIQASVLREAGTAVILQHGDIVGTELAIERLLARRGGEAGVPNWAFIRSFERSALASKLAATLNELVLN